MKCVHHVMALSVLLLAACGTIRPVSRPASADLRACLDLYDRTDREVAAAGVRDAGFARVPGFPFLRVDRYSASFNEDTADPERFARWLHRLRANDARARQVELRNLDADSQRLAAWQAELQACGDRLQAAWLRDEARRERLRALAEPIDGYSTTGRVLGFYLLARPFLEAGVAEFQQSVLADYADPVDALSTPGPRVLWSPRTSADEPGSRTRAQGWAFDHLANLDPADPDLVKLARYHAPRWWIETAGRHDVPGVPVQGERGPDVDTTRPTIYFLPALTRFGQRSLLQISYFAWFSERPPQKPGDAEAGPLDGVIWRVTVDADGKALFHDTIHACGCYHYGYPRADLVRRDEAPGDHVIFMPQGTVADGEIAIRLQSGTHAVRRVVPLSEADAKRRRQYVLRPYAELLNLPGAGDTTYSLFDEDGMVAGSERRERLWLWVSGVPNAGGMRQWGRHATAFVGKAYFDDPLLLERLFVMPGERGPVP